MSDMMCINVSDSESEAEDKSMHFPTEIIHEGEALAYAPPIGQPQFVRDEFVRMHGLVSSAYLNGVLAKVLGYSSDTDRCILVLSSGGTVNVKTSNMMYAAEPPVLGLNERE